MQWMSDFVARLKQLEKLATLSTNEGVQSLRVRSRRCVLPMNDAFFSSAHANVARWPVYTRGVPHRHPAMCCSSTRSVLGRTRNERGNARSTISSSFGDDKRLPHHRFVRLVISLAARVSSFQVSNCKVQRVVAMPCSILVRSSTRFRCWPSNGSCRRMRPRRRRTTTKRSLCPSTAMAFVLNCCARSASERARRIQRSSISTSVVWLCSPRHSNRNEREREFDFHSDFRGIMW